MYDFGEEATYDDGRVVTCELCTRRLAVPDAAFGRIPLEFVCDMAVDLWGVRAVCGPR